MSTLTRFTLSVPHKTYTVEDVDARDFENHVKLYMKKYKDDIIEDEKEDLLKKKKYVRIMCFQDSPTSARYIKCYCRNISEMIPNHKREADEYLKLINGEDEILVEINYATMGFFECYKF
jgi:hypothetical protein